MVKLFSIGFLILILMMPSSWIQDLIFERQYRADAVIEEITNKWSGSQTISGPVLVIPFKKQEVIDKGKEGKEIREHVEKAFFLPEQLNVKGNLKPDVLHRGIFDAVVYESSLEINTRFAKPNFKNLSIADDMVLWNEAYMIFGLSDLRGVSDNFTFTLNKEPLASEPSNNIGILVSQTQTPSTSSVDYATDNIVVPQGPYSNGIVAKLNWQRAENFTGDITLDFNLKGSKQLNFVPIGKTTSVALSGAWTDPSFDGAFLPATREVSDAGFTASWKILHFNRPFPQQWVGENQNLTGADFGVKLLLPVDQYQKSIRTSKYGILVILLTFVALFMVEITQKIRIHPFQYILIGAALIIYYTLLLSFSEHFGYNVAYAISSLATVILLSLYSSTFLKTAKLVVLFTLLLIVFYIFIFVIILQQDFSLLLGSIGLFLIIGSIMYFSRKVKWYNEAIA